MYSLFLAYFTTNDRKSLIVCDKLKRPEIRLPSAKRICIDVVGCAVSNFNCSFALKRIFYIEIHLNFDLDCYCICNTYNFSFSSFLLADGVAATAAAIAAATADDAIDVLPSLIFGVGLNISIRQKKKKQIEKFNHSVKFNTILFK